MTKKDMEKKLKYKFIETAPVPYAPIGKGLAIVDIEMLQSAIHKTEKRIFNRVIDGVQEWSRKAWTFGWVRKWSEKTPEGFVDDGEIEASLSEYLDLYKIVNHSKQGYET